MRRKFPDDLKLLFVEDYLDELPPLFHFSAPIEPRHRTGLGVELPEVPGQGC
jgi:hypothetical protein